MTDSAPSSPSRLLKAVSRLATGLLRLLLALWLLLIIAWGVLLHDWIVPPIENFRPQLQTLMTQALGAPVTIGAITKRAQGLALLIELSDVALLDASGRRVLHLPRVAGTLSARSLLNRGFAQLYLEAPDLEVRRTADGRIHVAGLELARNQDGSGDAAANWLFAQSEIVVKGGTLRWTDEQRPAPQVALEQVDLVLRNGNWRHRLRMDASPPSDWGDRFSVVGLFRAPLLQAGDSNWRHWSGQLFADFARLDAAQLHHHAGPDAPLTRGYGALRAWADVRHGQIVGATLDLALADVHTTLGPGLQALMLPSFQGRLEARQRSGGFEFSTQALQFQTDDGLHWPGGNLRLAHTAATDKTPAQGELHADRLNLAALARIASRLPLDAAVHDALRRHSPQGLVDAIDASWTGPLDDPQQYRVRGRVQGLALAGSSEDGKKGAAPSHPGLRGATLDIDMTQAGGRAALSIASGALLLPGVFEDPVLPLDKLSANVRWQLAGERIAVQASDVQFANADVQGQVHAAWHTSDAAKAPQRARFPGVLDLTGSLSRADGTRVHRYLPLAVAQEARHYVRDAITAGSASNVRFRVKGDLQDLPFNDPRQGEFRIAARVRNVTYAYVPDPLQPTDSPHWPALTGLSGELIFERSSMQVRGATGRFAGSKELRLSRVDASIPNLEHTVVNVSADSRGPLPELLALMSRSPLGRMTGHALDQASGSGDADFQLRLNLPIHELHNARVQGSVTLPGNALRITPDTPALSRVRGTVQFSESGFSLQGVQAQALGGGVRLEGGMRALDPHAAATEPSVQLHAQGIMSAEGLQQAFPSGMLSQLARRATGSAPYTLALAFRRGVPELQVHTSLQGMALALPAPLGKSAESSLPLRFENRLTRESLAGPAGNAAVLRDQLSLDLGALGSASYLRDLSGPQTRVLRGTIGIGLGHGESAPLPAQGVAANIQQAQLDLDAWAQVLEQPAETRTPARPSSAAAGPGVAQDYLPGTLALRARQLTLQGRTLHNLVAGVQREGSTWRATLDAVELNGHLEYRPPTAPEQTGGRVFARLARLSVPQNDVAQVESLLDERPGDLPALDIVVDAFELRGKRLGRLEIQAQNRGEGMRREWQLSQFDLLTPQASLSASGNWAQPSPGPTERRTQLDFELEIHDAGALLDSLGMADTVRNGKGRMQGQLAWTGTPFSPDYRSMAGQIHLNVASGQFLQADPGGPAKLLSVLSLQSLPRRLALDFRDVFSKGFAFDFVRGDVRIDQGLATTNNLQMKGVSAAVLMEGSADIAHETQNLRVLVVPEINALTASLVATAINPVIGLGSFLAQIFLRRPLIEAATREFRVDGTWSEPRVVRIRRKGRATDPGDSTPTAPADDSADDSADDFADDSVHTTPETRGEPR
ncbi:TIGR02099 family protein [Verminephrobacter aporrectodeae subsp. tuberculatae]|uniref:YhdP family protein n=1 Tax=Verminephrobacter aporrectodeae TaxID=1110389 RepID=UPI002242CB01|nr:YhdP family protein [Verminephrobacter aporrectodeae]MCW8165552.1 TIGR02099 family protein [Verminephrobacter aporrectodeae subsp. tuberculatae]MCW8171050.1 TIGR02099 family protein [Verminephrobacter aporrectodeae subsp. tuberculatae]